MIGYRVVTATLLMGDQVYRCGEFISLEEAGHQLDYVEGFNLTEKVFADDHEFGHPAHAARTSMLNRVSVNKTA